MAGANHPLRWACVVMVLALFGCGPDLDGLEPGELAVVVAAYDGGALRLDDGRRLLLAEIEPLAADDVLASEARAALETMTVGRAVRLAYGGERALPSRDGRPETAIAHVFAKTESGAFTWVQAELVRRGLARVRPRAQNAARTAPLLQLEQAAREARYGLWADVANRVRSLEDLMFEEAVLPGSCQEGPYLILEGVIERAAVTSRAVYLNFGAPGEEQRDVTLRIDARSAPLWIEQGLTPQAYEGRNVRARGRVATRGGPLMCVEHPAAIELLNR